MAETSAFARRVAAAFGEQLQRVRRAQGWKQAAFAEAMGLSRTTVSNMERGEQRIFLDQVYRAADILSLSVDALMPAAHPLAPERIVRAAADDPLSPSLARALAHIVEEVRVEEVRTAPATRRPVAVGTRARPDHATD
jgi:transcriptional regulator with XRE-family HTH domain